MTKKTTTAKQPVKETKPKEKSRRDEVVSSPWVDWLRANWKTTLLVSAVTFLVFFMKVHEEMSGGFSTTAQATEDLYAALGVDSGADLKEIRKQFNKLAVEFHPDRHPDCATCAERFRRISAAYEVLSSPESREHYDQTAGVLEPIRSATTSLTTANFHRLVLESPDVWLVQIFSESSNACQNFAGFWEEFAIEHNYLRFGRINISSQPKLVSRLPYAVDELPTVLSFTPGEHSELLELEYDRSPNAVLRAFARTALGEHYRTILPDAIPALSNSRGSRAKLLLVNFDSPPLFFLYIAQRFGEFWEVIATPLGNHRAAQQRLGDSQASAQVVAARTPSAQLPDRVFTSGQSTNALRSLLSYTMATSIPGCLTRTVALWFRGILRGSDHPPS